jgi:outer membrane receptor protein involved in Fe transport
LYGTEAAAGVIQIFTKRGRSGAGQWTLETRQGMAYLRPWGVQEAKYMFTDPILQHGHRQMYQTSVSGGSSDQLSYYVSGQFEDNEGAVYQDDERIIGTRGNLQFRPHPAWLLDFSNSFTSSRVNNATQSGTGSAAIYTAHQGDFGGRFNRLPEVLRNLNERPNVNEITRNLYGVTLTYTPFQSFTNRFTIGNDDSRFEAVRLLPFGHREVLEPIVGRDFTDNGSINRVSTRNTIRSIDFVSTLAFDVLSELRSTLSFGFQGSENQEETLWASGDRFPGPGDYTISSAASRQAFQTEIRALTGGFFFQDMLAFNDRYFVTLGLRVDGSSAFGSGFGLQSYPKASVSYVLSDESFWPERLGSLKLRGAYGWAGRAPGAFDAVKTWSPIGWGSNEAAYVPGNRGNPDLGPERTRELEVGFDGTFFGERLTAIYTYYSRLTTDALFAVGQSPSLGGWSRQLENVGELRSWGHEISVNGTPLAMSSFRWDLGVGLTLGNSEVVSLGGSPPFAAAGRERGWIIEGQPVPVLRGDWIENYWEKAEPKITTDKIIGPNYPPYILNLNVSLTLPGGIAISSRGEYQGGFYMLNNLDRLQMARAIPIGQCYDAYRKVDPNWTVGAPGSESPVPIRPAQWPADMYAWERAKCWGAGQEIHVLPIRFFELRDVTLSVPLSNVLPSLVDWGSRTDLTISSRNVWYWKNRELGTGHPEQTERRGIGSNPYPINRGIGHIMPPPSILSVSFRTVF